MSYVDAFLDRDQELIQVVERDSQGQRVYREYRPDYTFYFPSKSGKFRGPRNEPLERFVPKNRAEFQRERRIHGDKTLYESDINPVFKCLSTNYIGQDAPRLHTVFLDIETDFDRERGFASPQDPFSAVTAISLYLDWMDALITLVMAPASMDTATAREIVSGFENTFLFDSEVEMFNAFFEFIEDSDVLTGWNSEGYDLPYLVNRTIRIMSRDDTRRFCLWNQYPQERTYERFGKSEQKYELIGRVHLDYLQLYKKYNYESRHSYKLDFIGELEVGENKVQYEGSLDQLYNQDFARFIDYNRQDTLLVYKIHKKLQFLELANQIAHENTVLLPTVMGSVAMIEQAIINEAHKRDIIIPDKLIGESKNETDQAAGAYVANPKTGIHEWIGAVDINSLYPSVIRSLNLAPETIVGQLRQTITEKYMAERAAKIALGRRKLAEGDEETAGLLWDGLFAAFEYEAVMRQERGTMITIDWETGGSDEYSAAEIYEMIFNRNQPWILTANGTIFTAEREGIIPGLLTKWFSDRKVMQRQAKESTDPDKRAYWDKRQLVRKILLNSAYGAILNNHCRFYDKRIGQSVTLSGRQIVRHMNAYINETITGEYDYQGATIIYSDSVTGDSIIRTDSGDVTIEELFNRSLEYNRIGEKEYGVWNETKVLGFDSFSMTPIVSRINYVMRHKTKKKLYKITTENGKCVTVTEDHSIMVDRDGFLIECLPNEIKETDLIITFAEK